MSLSRSTVKAVAVGGLALSTIAVGVVAANAAPTALPELSTAGSYAGDTAEGSAPMGRGPHGLRGQQHPQHAGELAERLGVEQDALEDAMATLRENRREEGQGAMATALAEELGLDEATVTSTFEELRTERQATARTTFAERLDAAVEDGTLTEADKESVLKAFDAGVLGRGPGGQR